MAYVLARRLEVKTRGTVKPRQNENSVARSNGTSSLLNRPPRAFLRSWVVVIASLGRNVVTPGWFFTVSVGY
jgi:hypothetical protein